MNKTGCHCWRNKDEIIRDVFLRGSYTWPIGKDSKKESWESVISAQSDEDEQEENNLSSTKFCRTNRPHGKDEGRREGGEYLNLARELKHEGDCDTSHCWSTWNNLKETWKKTRRTGDLRKNQDHPDYENPLGYSEKSWSSAFTQTPIKKKINQRELVCKTYNE